MTPFSVSDDWMVLEPGALPGWSDEDHFGVFQVFAKSFAAACAYSGHVEEVAEVALVRAALQGMRDDVDRLTRSGQHDVGPAQAREFFETQFVVAGRRGEPRGLLTGYYAPVIDGCFERTDQTPYPLYRTPSALRDGGAVPFNPSRAEIDAGALDGQGLELIYLADAVDAFFLHVQGSGLVRLPSGALVPVTFDSKTSHPYTSIGRSLIDDGVVSADEMSLARLEEWLRGHPDKATAVMQRNASYVFFREGEPGVAALGALDVGLTSERSMAVDPRLYALGLPIHLSVPGLDIGYGVGTMSRGFNRLVVAQDVGSAILGAERGDLYWGVGDAAKVVAGDIKHPCSFGVLLPRSVFDAGV